VFLSFGPVANGMIKSAHFYLTKYIFRLHYKDFTVDALFGQGTKGLSAPAIKNKLALRASLTGSVFMDSVRVSHDALLPKSKGLASAFSCLNNAR
jgi:hypothetical protein